MFNNDRVGKTSMFNNNKTGKNSQFFTWPMALVNEKTSIFIKLEGYFATNSKNSRPSPVNDNPLQNNRKNNTGLNNLNSK